jgi:hypothetical protein
MLEANKFYYSMSGVVGNGFRYGHYYYIVSVNGDILNAVIIETCAEGKHGEEIIYRSHWSDQNTYNNTDLMETNTMPTIVQHSMVERVFRK